MSQSRITGVVSLLLTLGIGCNDDDASSSPRKLGEKCSDEAACVEGARCAKDRGESEGYCYAVCSKDSDCSAGVCSFGLYADGGLTALGVCFNEDVGADGGK
jgi:hypothetical protein